MGLVNGFSNNVKLATRLSGRCKYAFVDTAEHRADRILIGALIPVSFEPGRPVDSSGAYELRTCSFESKYEQWFLNCMDDLVLAMNVEGRGDYLHACKELLGAGVAA